MIEKPTFKACYHVEILDSDHVFLLREDVYKVLSGRRHKEIAPYLNGTHTVMDIAAALKGKQSLSEIFYVLKQLQAQGCVVEANGDMPAAQRAFFHALDLDDHAALSRLQQTPVALSAVGEVDLQPLRQALQREGIVEGNGENGVQVVVVDDYLREELADLNRDALRSGRPWMPVKLVGSTSWIGPLFQPGESACWACLAQRLRANRQVESYLARKSARSGPIVTSLAATPLTVATAANLATTEIVKWLAGDDKERLVNQLITFDHLNMELESHTVVRRPQCAVCGDPEATAHQAPVTLNGVQSPAYAPGLRTRGPQETFEQFKHHISPITGIVTGLNDTTWDENGLVYNYAAGHYFPLVVDSVYWLQQNVKSHTGGKGISPMQAKVSAIGEAIERYSTIYWGYEPAVRSTYQDIASSAIHPHDCLGYSKSQYANRETLNQQLNRGSYQVLPVPFDETVEVDWVPVWSLTQDEPRHVLATLCYYGHPDSRYFFNTIDSNGVAAGNSLEEAILYGFGELVERDSVAIWWYNRVARPAVDLDTLGNPYLSRLEQYYDTIGREFWVLDITTDLNIPAFAAISRRVDSPVEDIIYGFGAHLDPAVAIMQAITEMNQCLPAVKETNKDGTTAYKWQNRDAHEWWQEATVDNQPYLRPDPSLPAKRLSDYPALQQKSLQENVSQCVHLAQEAGLETLALDLTRPDIGMNVCRVIVPGLRHFWRRLGPGRLYEAPVKLGWLEQPRREEEMNRFAIIF
jgi:ribosomal protein S12 methylthiotransferase accessory factor